MQYLIAKREKFQFIFKIISRFVDNFYCLQSCFQIYTQIVLYHAYMLCKGPYCGATSCPCGEANKINTGHYMDAREYQIILYLVLNDIYRDGLFKRK